MSASKGNVNLNTVMANINKRFGANTVSFMGDIKDKMTVKRLSSPSYEFDLMLYGGIAKGKIIELFGPESSGKTSMAIEIIKKNQEKAKREGRTFMVGWYETESSVDPEYLESLGVDISCIAYWDQANIPAEQGFDVLRALVDSGKFDMMVINSIAGLCPSKEMSDEMDKQNVGLIARLLSRLFRVITGSASKNNCTLLFINQIREKVGVMFGNPETTTGGRALGFYASQRIHMRRVKQDANDPITLEEGVKIHCKTIKNRFAKGNPFTTCDYFARYNEGIDRELEVINILERENLISKKGAWFRLLDEEGNTLVLDGFECVWQGKNNLTESFKNNNAVKEYINGLLESLLGDIKTKSLSNDEIEQIMKEEKELEKEFKELK